MTKYEVTAVGFRGYAQGEEFETDDLTEDEERDAIERGWIQVVKETKRKEAGENG